MQPMLLVLSSTKLTEILPTCQLSLSKLSGIEIYSMRWQLACTLANDVNHLDYWESEGRVWQCLLLNCNLVLC